MTALAVLETFDAQYFMDTHWGKSPCLIRGWLTPDPVSVEQLLGLADQHELPSRLVIGSSRAQNWQIEHGPLELDDLPETSRDWTLLVQEVDKASPEVATILEAFRFLPHWILDDVMISQAVPGGSVGPHRDAYDVFLVQTEGERQWELSSKHPFALDERFELALIANWQAEHAVTSQVGDVLYLPAGIGHHGVAINNCQTWSIGVRTPSGPELLFQLAEDNLERPEFSKRLRVDQVDPLNPDQISRELLAQARTLLAESMAMDDDRLSRLLASFLTRWRLWPNDDFIELATVTRQLRAGNTLALASTARLGLVEIKQEQQLFVNGEPIHCPSELGQALSRNRTLSKAWLEHEQALEQLLEVSAIARPKGPSVVR